MADPEPANGSVHVAAAWLIATAGPIGAGPKSILKSESSTFEMPQTKGILDAYTIDVYYAKICSKLPGPGKSEKPSPCGRQRRGKPPKLDRRCRAACTLIAGLNRGRVASHRARWAPSWVPGAGSGKQKGVQKAGPRRAPPSQSARRGAKMVVEGLSSSSA